MLRQLKALVAGLAAGVCALSSAHAAVITFGPGPLGSPVAATIEGIFAYDTFSGALFRDTQGNGDGFNMEGLSGTGGVLRVVRDDVAGGLFTFDGVDVAWQFNVADFITFEGFRLGISQGSDSFLTTADSSYATVASAVLAGVSIDELRVTMNAPPGTASVIDNLVVSPTASVPEPATLALLGMALAGAGFSLRRKH